MEEIIKHITNTNASFRTLDAGDAKNTDIFLDRSHFDMFKESGETVNVRLNKTNLEQAILFISSILPRKYDKSNVHKIVEYSTKFVVDELHFLGEVFKENGKQVPSILQQWKLRIEVPQKNQKIDLRFYLVDLIKQVKYIDSSGNEATRSFIIRDYLAGGYSDLHIKKDANGIYDVTITNSNQFLDVGKKTELESEFSSIDTELPFQEIFYGAPGTGKSHSIKDKTKGCEVIRTTFHPDSDYSTFVGSYKPTSKENDDDVIVYRFVEQAFLQAYTSAWKKYGAANNSTDPEKVFLVIEEINRGNCAQIFGDLFQLLDRNDYGFSDYPIKADADMKKQLSNSFNGLNIVLSESINNFYDEKDTISKVISGDILLIPNNLYIWATMNTSDQSLFPIDSAFKRRWNWNYIPIANANLGWKIQIENDKYDWWDFLVKINSKIGETTNSEDKKLGYFFCKARNNVISEHAFVNKVIFYLWNDVFKDYDFDDTIFNDENGSKLSFDKFYTVENNITKIDSTKIKTFLTNLNVSNLTELATSDSMQSEDMQN